MENGPSLDDWNLRFHGELMHMDQANTLRHLLGQQHAVIHPILGDMGSDYAACLGRFVLEQQAQRDRVTALFDGSSEGLLQLLPQGARHDLIEFFNGKLNLEDQVVQLGDRQYLVPAKLGLQALAGGLVGVFGGLRKTSSLVKLAESDPRAAAVISYVPEGAKGYRIVPGTPIPEKP